MIGVLLRMALVGLGLYRPGSYFDNAHVLDDVSETFGDLSVQPGLRGAA